MEYQRAYGIVDPKTPDRDVRLSSGATVAVRSHLGYAPTRDMAQEAAGLIGEGAANAGIAFAREEPSFSQRGVFAMTLGACRGCGEGVCTIRSHRES